MNAKESDLQAAVIAWARLNVHRWPDLHLLHAIPNAGGYTGGFRQNVARVQAMKREGVKMGVPDLHLPVARGGYHSLYVEMKREVVHVNKTKPPRVERTQPTAEQAWWHEALTHAGNRVVVCWTAEEAQATLTEYLTCR